MARGVYIARLDNTSVSTARTLVGINVASTCAAVVLECFIDFSSVASTSIRVRIKKHTTAGTSTAFTPIVLSGAAALSTAGNNYTVEGTLGDTIFDRFVNFVPGMNYLPIPEQRIDLAPSARFGIEFPTAPAAAVTLSAGITWLEIG